MQQYVLTDYDFGNFPPESIVLDVGCGAGKQMKKVQERGCFVVGIERESKTAKLSRHLRLSVVQAAAENIPIRTESLDGVICKVVIPYTQEAEALSEIARVLKPGGVAYICYHGSGYYLSYIMTCLPWKYKVYGVRTLLNTWLYVATGKRLPSFLGDTIYQAKPRLRKYYVRLGLQLNTESPSGRFLGFPVFIYHSLRKFIGPNLC